jgi:N-acetyl-gamma-glutamyl-phosphate reductase
MTEHDTVTIATPAVAIAGATGYAGQELLRLLAGHPGVRIVAAMSSGGEARRLPALARIWDADIQPLDRDRLVSDADIVFMALPEHASATLGPALAAAGTRVIDLSGAFRLRDDDSRQRWYPDAPALPPGTVYGLTEHYRDAIVSASYVANPGCYPTAAALALRPLAQAGLLQGDIIIDAKSGISGAGKTPSERTHFSEVHGSLSAYGVFNHRHAAEMEQEVGGPVTFVPHLVPINRGILETIYVRLAPGRTAADVKAAFDAAYALAPFVRLFGDALPDIKQVAYTNFCDIGWKVDETTGRAVIVSCIDNLVKGAAGQAIQNLNVMCRLDERTGLWR